VDGAPLVYLDSANSSRSRGWSVEAIEDHYLNHNARTWPPRCMCWEPKRPEAFEDSPRSTGEVHRPRTALRKWCSPRTLRGTEPVRVHARRVAPSRRRDRHLGHGAPLEHRSVAAAGTAHRRVLRWFDVTDEGRLDLDKRREG
jgi:cysteine desulfurase/selenocysteine lyase